MKVLETCRWLALSIAGMSLAACDRHVEEQPANAPPQVQNAAPQPVNSPQPPQYLAPQPQYLDQQPQYVVVTQAPPPIIVENRPPPSAGLTVWVDGYWNWSNQRYNWEVGHYANPPQQGAVWVGPRYDHDA